jgi:hypothetical protein
VSSQPSIKRQGTARQNDQEPRIANRKPLTADFINGIGQQRTLALRKKLGKPDHSIGR